MLNLLEINCAPTRQDVEAYVQANFSTCDGSYRIPVHQISQDSARATAERLKVLELGANLVPKHPDPG